eukprot:CAMPEP_0176412798 /NCGR_PEP_ID=MMETSP0127-20121128/4342_1 /TAXON_ID=938130 /ORGANISM="Platyophrya macrostoma, Strain WH" /LENGTH=52 /DNA_ID=CAMNT_0017792505 /DNA_START=234 /DNA_END=392 /DNA_ORIENTATION=-
MKLEDAGSSSVVFLLAAETAVRCGDETIVVHRGSHCVSEVRLLQQHGAVKFG